jgi:hypothetical protein
MGGDVGGRVGRPRERYTAGSGDRGGGGGGGSGRDTALRFTRGLNVVLRGKL